MRQLGRLLGKLARACPFAVFPLLLEQCQAYDNLIPPVIESCRYLTALEYDMLVYALVCALKARPMGVPERMKVDAVNVSNWLSRLATFMAQLAKRFAVDLTPVIDHLVGAMGQGRAVDVVLLDELVKTLGGIEERWEYSDVHTDLLASGAVLRTELLAPKGRNRPAVRLFESVDREDLWLALARQPEATLFDESVVQTESVKLASACYDAAVASLLQFCDFVRAGGDVIYATTAGTRAPRMGKVVEGLAVQSEEGAEAPGISMPIRSLLTRTAMTSVGAGMSLTGAQSAALKDLFWGLDYADLHVPVGRYQNELARLKTFLLQLPAASQAPGSNGQPSQGQKDREKTLQIVASLEQELKVRMQHVQQVSQTISNLSPVEVTGEGFAARIQELAQDLVYQRAVLSLPDVEYCTKWLLHLLKPVSIAFYMMDYYVGRLGELLASQSEREAKHFGHLVKNLWECLHGWHEGQEKFASEAQIFSVHPEGTDAVAMQSKEEPISWPVYRDLVYKLHDQVTAACLAFLIPDGDFVGIRSTVIFLTSTASQFPRVTKHCRMLSKSLARMVKEEAREDVKVLCIRAHATMAKLLQDYSNSKGEGAASGGDIRRLVREGQFHEVKEVEAEIEELALDEHEDLPELEDNHNMGNEDVNTRDAHLEEGHEEAIDDVVIVVPQASQEASADIELDFNDDTGEEMPQQVVHEKVTKKASSVKGKQVKQAGEDTKKGTTRTRAKASASSESFTESEVLSGPVSLVSSAAASQEEVAGDNRLDDSTDIVSVVKVESRVERQSPKRASSSPLTKSLSPSSSLKRSREAILAAASSSTLTTSSSGSAIHDDAKQEQGSQSNASSADRGGHDMMVDDEAMQGAAPRKRPTMPKDRMPPAKQQREQPPAGSVAQTPNPADQQLKNSAVGNPSPANAPKPVTWQQQPHQGASAPQAMQPQGAAKPPPSMPRTPSQSQTPPPSAGQQRGGNLRPPPPPPPPSQQQQQQQPSHSTPGPGQSSNAHPQTPVVQTRPSRAHHDSAPRQQPSRDSIRDRDTYPTSASLNTPRDQSQQQRPYYPGSGGSGYPNRNSSRDEYRAGFNNQGARDRDRERDRERDNDGYNGNNGAATRRAGPGNPGQQQQHSQHLQGQVLPGQGYGNQRRYNNPGR